MRILVLCGDSLPNRQYRLPVLDIKGTLKDCYNAYVEEPGRDQTSISVHVQSHHTWRNSVSFVQWVIKNTDLDGYSGDGDFDAIIVDKSTFKGITPFDTYVWYSLLDEGGQLLILDKLPLCDLTKDISDDVLDVYALKKLKVDNFITPLFDYDSDIFVKRAKPIVNPWPLILQWVCGKWEGANRRDMKRVLALAPDHIINMFVRLGDYAIKSVSTGPGAKQRSEHLLEILSSIGPVVVPPTPVGLCANVRGLDWKRNSCYMDSSLQCMLAVPSVLNHYLLNVELDERPPRLVSCGIDPVSDLTNRGRLQEELRYIASTIRGNASVENTAETADKFRLLLRTCNLAEGRRWWSPRTQEAGEFISWLLDLFPVARGVATQRSYVTNDLVTEDLSTMTLSST